MKALRSYPKVWNIGHPNTDRLFDGPVVVQEKIDGSQFSFGVVGGELHMRSKGAEIFLPVKDKLFKGASETAHRLHAEQTLPEGWTFRGEAICRPKHNALQYERTPAGNVILFDIDSGLERRLDPGQVRDVAERMGLEVVPTLYVGEVSDADQVRELLSSEPHLGGEMIEGVVVKNPTVFLDDGKQLMGKYVSERFKEVHSSEWKKANPGKGDIVQGLIERLRTERRWEKAIERRRDAGELQSAPQDIGPLLQDIQADIEAEEAERIKEALYKHFSKQILRGAVGGFPEWYKDRLLEGAFK